MTRPKKLTPYLECNIGGSLAAAKETNGGFYLSPSVGAQVKLTQKLKMNIALSYEIQQVRALYPFYFTSLISKMAKQIM